MEQSYPAPAPKWASYMVIDSACRYLSSLEPGQITYNCPSNGLPELDDKKPLSRPE